MTRFWSCRAFLSISRSLPASFWPRLTCELILHSYLEAELFHSWKFYCTINEIWKFTTASNEAVLLNWNCCFSIKSQITKVASYPGSFFAPCPLIGQPGEKWLPPAWASHEAGLVDGSYSDPASIPCPRRVTLCDLNFVFRYHVGKENTAVFKRADYSQHPGPMALLGTNRRFKILISFKIIRKNKYHHKK